MTEHPAAHRLEGHAAGDADPEVARHLEACAPCAHYVATLTEESARYAGTPPPLTATAPSRLRPRPVRNALAALPFLAAAAAVVVALRMPGEHVPPSDESPPTHFKGAIQVAVVRDRGPGEQERFANDVHVAAHDRLRVEVAVDSERPVTAGILDVDGSWLVLLAPSLLDGGTHLSERAAQVDDTPSNGWILAGSPEAVARARATRVFDDVVVVPVVAGP